MNPADLRALVAQTPVEQLPELVGELAGAQAAAFARLAVPSPAPTLAEDRLLAMPEVAARLGVTEYQAREMGRRGRLPIVRVGERRVRVSVRALDDWIRRGSGISLPRSRGR